MCVSHIKETPHLCHIRACVCVCWGVFVCVCVRACVSSSMCHRWQCSHTHTHTHPDRKSHWAKRGMPDPEVSIKDLWLTDESASTTLTLTHTLSLTGLHSLSQAGSLSLPSSCVSVSSPFPLYLCTPPSLLPTILSFLFFFTCPSHSHVCTSTCCLQFVQCSQTPVTLWTTLSVSLSPSLLLFL